MLIRTKSGNFHAGNALALGKQSLLDFLGVKKEAAGIQKVAGEVELIASVPIRCRTSGMSGTGGEETETEKGYPWTLSTFDLDRFGERIDPQGWEFKRYMQNPVVQWAHRYDIPAIGKIGGLTADNDGLHGLVFFNDKEFDAFGWSVGERVKAGVIRAGSVGFRVIEIEIPSKEDAPNGGKDGTSLIFRKQELLEFSICNVPANPFALAKTAGAAETEQSRELVRPDFWGGLINKL